MLFLDITDTLRKELLSGNSKILKDGLVTFDKLSFYLGEKELKVCFYYKEDLLAITRLKTYTDDAVYHFQLIDGQMRIDIPLTGGDI